MSKRKLSLTSSACESLSALSLLLFIIIAFRSSATCQLITLQARPKPLLNYLCVPKRAALAFNLSPSVEGAPGALTGIPSLCALVTFMLTCPTCFPLFCGSFAGTPNLLLLAASLSESVSPVSLSLDLLSPNLDENPYYGLIGNVLLTFLLCVLSCQNLFAEQGCQTAQRGLSSVLPLVIG